MIIAGITYNPILNSYIMGNKHIYVNPTDECLQHKAKAVGNKKEKRVHIFLPSAYILRNDNFKKFMEAWFTDPKDVPSVTIHIGKNMPDMKVVLTQYYIPRLDTVVKAPSIKVFCEDQVLFKIRDSHPFFIKFAWNKIGKLVVNLEIESYPQSGYEKHYCDHQPASVVMNEIQAAFPSVFKDRMIQAFKEKCPPGILKIFKSDDAVWEYILQEGEWKVD